MVKLGPDPSWPAHLQKWYTHSFEPDPNCSCSFCDRERTVRMDSTRDEFGFPQVPWERIKFYLREAKDKTLSRKAHQELKDILESLP